MRGFFRRIGRIAAKAARGSSVLLVLPLTLLQTFEASSLFCAGLSHESLLSFNCPHHAAGGHGGHGTPGSHAMHAAAGGGAGHMVPANPSGDVTPPVTGDDCNCPSTGVPVPDGLTHSVLSGVGVPVLERIAVPAGRLVAAAASRDAGSWRSFAEPPPDRPPLS
ncbi:MAG: hypothetical protein ACE5HF_09690 [Gemmatimonadota bacterium]